MLRRLLVLPLVLGVFAFATVSARAATVAFANGVPPNFQVISGAKMTALADRAVARLLTNPDRVLVLASKVADQYVPLGTVELALLAPTQNASYVTVPVQITVDGRVVRTIAAGYRVQQYIHTAVAAHDLAPGTILSPGDLTLARVPYVGRPPVDVGELVNRRLRTSLPTGMEVSVEQTAAVNLVSAGAGVILLVRDGGVELTADMVARTSGAMGDTVSVYDPKTDKVLSGTVTGANTVELDLPGDDAQ